MEQSIKEQHGYFSLAMNYAFESEFKNTECIHKRCCFVFAEHGTVHYQWKDTVGSCNAPAVFCINERERFEVRCKEGIHVLLFHPEIINSSFDFENIRSGESSFSVTERQDIYLLSSFLGEKRRIVFPDCFLSQRIRVLMKKFEKEIVMQDSDFWPCKSRSCLLELFSLLLMEKEEVHDGLEQEELVADIKSFLLANMDKKITIPDLTKQFHLNRTDLSKIFLEKTGLTIMQFVMEKRMELAASLLRNTELPGSVIMERVGMNQYGYFSRLFKKYNGISPREYRRTYGK